MFKRSLATVLVLMIVLAFSMTAVFADEPAVKRAEAIKGTPVIDGKVDDMWANATPITDFTAIQGASENTVDARAAWDESNLYVLFQVKDSELDDSFVKPVGASQRDAVEVYMDETNSKPTSMNWGEQYYVIVDISGLYVGDGPSFPTTDSGLVYAVEKLSDGYVIEMGFPMISGMVTLAEGTVLGFDMQVDDAKDGARYDFLKWNDMTGNGWYDASVFGELELKGAAINDETPVPSPEASAAPVVSEAPAASPEASVAPAASPETSVAPAASPAASPAAVQQPVEEKKLPDAGSNMTALYVLAALLLAGGLFMQVRKHVVTK